MPTFRDVHGQHYDIPTAELARFLAPEPSPNTRLAGAQVQEAQPSQASPSTPGYIWQAGSEVLLQTEQPAAGPNSRIYS